MLYRPLILVVLLAVALLPGCATLNSWSYAGAKSLESLKTRINMQLKADPAEGTGYVPMEQLAQNPELPFNKVWIKQGVDFQRYRTLYIAPVNTDYVKNANWWQETVRADQMQQDVQNLAAYMRTQFIEAFQNDPRHRFRVVSVPEPGSLTLALALTELVPSHVVLNALKIAAPYGSGLAVSALERGTEAKSTVAFEARINDTGTNESLAMAADREYATVRPIDLKGFTWYGNAQDIMKQWAEQFVEIANRQPGEVIKPASTFSLKPW